MKNRGARLKVDPSPTIRRALEDGVAYGWKRAHKYTDPDHKCPVDDDQAQDAIVQAVLVAFNENGVSC